MYNDTKMRDEYLSLNKILLGILDTPSKGGNCSVKQDDYIMIKPSGIDLKKDAEKFVCFDYRKMKSEDVLPKVSMEIDMHLNINSKYVLHYHPIYLMPELCSEHFNKNNLISKTIDYIRPGKKLGEEIKKLNLSGYGVIYLKNHGVTIYADKIEIIEKLHSEIFNEFYIYIDAFYTPDLVVDNGDENYLYKLGLLYLSKLKGIELKELTEKEQIKLELDENEKYRMEK